MLGGQASEPGISHSCVSVVLPEAHQQGNEKTQERNERSHIPFRHLLLHLVLIIPILILLFFIFTFLSTLSAYSFYFTPHSPHPPLLHSSLPHHRVFYLSKTHTSLPSTSPTPAPPLPPLSPTQHHYRHVLQTYTFISSHSPPPSRPFSLPLAPPLPQLSPPQPHSLLPLLLLPLFFLLHLLLSSIHVLFFKLILLFILPLLFLLVLPLLLLPLFFLLHLLSIIHVLFFKLILPFILLFLFFFVLPLLLFLLHLLLSIILVLFFKLILPFLLLILHVLLIVFLYLIHFLHIFYFLALSLQPSPRLPSLPLSLSSYSTFHRLLSSTAFSSLFTSSITYFPNFSSFFPSPCFFLTSSFSLFYTFPSPPSTPSPSPALPFSSLPTFFPLRSTQFPSSRPSRPPPLSLLLLCPPKCEVTLYLYPIEAMVSKRLLHLSQRNCTAPFLPTPKSPSAGDLLSRLGWLWTSEANDQNRTTTRWCDNTPTGGRRARGQSYAIRALVLANSSRPWYHTPRDGMRNPTRWSSLEANAASDTSQSCESVTTRTVA
ncbi:unnamed protein product [Protopolystoma xenopodis]|uniref:Uncharacterized protein n=1 Tax=Protopolystoma xenopodis TaxID=117903 RepID=A0A3S5A672_9PLAT|nr:unnamed protein product [Protopolystoma xenopodis]